MGDRKIIQMENDTFIQNLVYFYLKAKNEKEMAEAEQKRIGQDLQALLIAIGADTVQMETHDIVKSNGRTGSKLSEIKLLEKGVSPDVIAECWEGGTSYTYVQVKERKNGQ